MNILGKIKTRLFGETLDELIISIKEHRKYKNPISKSVAVSKATQFFKGYTASNTMHNEFVIKSIEYCFNGRYYDFDIIKMPSVHNLYKLEFACGINDIIFPMLYPNTPYMYEGVYEMFGVNIEAEDVVVDAGANMGIFTALANYRGASVIYAFEPLQDARDILGRTIKLNECEDRVVVVEKGLSENVGKISFNVNNDNIGAGSLVMGEESNQMEIEVITLDQYVYDNCIVKIDFIKADIEGAERLLLAGAVNVLKKYKPKLAICTYHLEDDKEVLTDIILKANPDYEIHYSDKKLFAI